MRLIDPRGRLLGVVNVIDLTVLLCGVALIPLGQFFYTVSTAMWEPAVIEVRPATSLAGEPQTVTILGKKFRRDSQVTVEDRQLVHVTFADVTRLEVEIPSDMPAGRHAVIVTNPDGRQGRWQGTFEVIPAPAVPQQQAPPPPIEKPSPPPAPTPPLPSQHHYGYVLALVSFITLDAVQFQALKAGAVVSDERGRLLLAVVEVFPPQSLPQMVQLPQEWGGVLAQFPADKKQVLAAVILQARVIPVFRDTRYYFPIGDQRIATGLIVTVPVNGVNLDGVPVADPIFLGSSLSLDQAMDTHEQ